MNVRSWVVFFFIRVGSVSVFFQHSIILGDVLLKLVRTLLGCDQVVGPQ